MTREEREAIIAEHVTPHTGEHEDGCTCHVIPRLLAEVDRLEAECTRRAGSEATLREDVKRLNAAQRALAEAQAREVALRSFVAMADENARDFLNDVLDAKHFGVVERGDARPLREISQLANPLLDAPTDDAALREFGRKVSTMARAAPMGWTHDDVVAAVLRGVDP